jgi:uncharacterized membrane protein
MADHADTAPLTHRIDIEETCRSPLDRTFDYVADYRAIPDWMFGVKRFVPVTAQDRGLGSEYDVELSLGVPIKLRIRTVEFDEGRAIGQDSVKGFKARSRWYFEPLGPEQTKVTATVSYDLPFGPAGRVMGKVIEPFVKQAVGHVSTHLRRNLEATT